VDAVPDTIAHGPSDLAMRFYKAYACSYDAAVATTLRVWKSRQAGLAAYVDEYRPCAARVGARSRA
jgi:hypothetical protein